jgi:hypothetical protein
MMGKWYHVASQTISSQKAASGRERSPAIGGGGAWLSASGRRRQVLASGGHARSVANSAMQIAAPGSAEGRTRSRPGGTMALIDVMARAQIGA